MRIELETYTNISVCERPGPNLSLCKNEIVTTHASKKIAPQETCAWCANVCKKVWVSVYIYMCVCVCVCVCVCACVCVCV